MVLMPSAWIWPAGGAGGGEATAWRFPAASEEPPAAVREGSVAVVEAAGAPVPSRVVDAGAWPVTTPFSACCSVFEPPGQVDPGGGLVPVPGPEP